MRYDRRKLIVGVTVVAFVFVNLFLLESVPVYAVTITPNPPIAGQPITFSGNSADVGGSIHSGFGCTGSQVGFVNTGGPGPYSFTLTGGLPAGPYSVSIVDDITPPTGCVNFTVIPAVAVGGEVFPINVGAVLAPWIALIIMITVALVAAGVFARRLAAKHKGQTSH